MTFPELRRLSCRLMVLSALAGLLLACGAGGPRPVHGGAVAEPAPSAPGVRCEAPDEDYETQFLVLDEDPCLVGEARTLAQLAERAAFGEESVEPLDALWDEGARGWTFGRAEELHESDVTLDPAHVAERTRAYAEETTDRSVTGLLRVEVTVAGDAAEVRAGVRRVWGMGEDGEEEVIELEARRTPSGWRVRGVRSWPTAEWSTGDESEGNGVLDAAHWARRDAEVARARAALEAAGGEEVEARRELVLALASSGRVVEARSVARAITESGAAEAEDWQRLAACAGLLGEAEERAAALAALATARRP